MTIRQVRIPAALKFGVMVGSFLTFATASHAEKVSLHQIDGSMVLDGELLGVKDDAYLIETSMGPLRVSIAAFECSGEACPEIGTDGPIIWDVSLWGKRRAFTEHVERIAELVDEKTDGAFVLSLDYGGLSSSRQNLNGIADGKFEMAQYCAGYDPEKTPSITVLELPFLGVSSLEQEVEVSTAVYEHPAVVEELAQWNATILMPSPLPQNNIIGVGFPPTSLAAFKAMNIRATGGVGRAIEALGATPISIPAPEVRASLEDGDLQAAAFAPHAHMAFGTLESASWWTTNLNPGAANCPVVVNTQALDGLPAEHRVALLSSVDEALDHYIANYNGATMDAWGPALQDRGIVEITINQEIVDTIDKEVAGPAAFAWITENAAEGLPAEEIYSLVVDTLAK